VWAFSKSKSNNNFNVYFWIGGILLVGLVPIPELSIATDNHSFVITSLMVYILEGLYCTYLSQKPYEIILMLIITGIWLIRQIVLRF
jgi:hypothetical protein